MAKILIVEDEAAINELLRRSLTLVGHECECAFDGAAALDMIRAGCYDLMLLDIMLPGMSGHEIMARRDAEFPVIMITAKAGLGNVVAGLDSGADDYITKPFEMLEVVARVNAVLRRVKKGDAVFSIGGVRVDMDAMKVYVDGGTAELTPQEFALLETLIVNRNLALSRGKLLELAWGYDYCGDTRTVDVHIQKLRKKLGLTKQIATVYKMGYRLETDV